MKNSKGSTLAVALSMVFLFSALGVGMLEFGGGQRQFSAHQLVNTQAFWLADAGLQQSIANGGVVESGTLGSEGTYAVTISGSGTVTLTSTGTATGQQPAIKRILQAQGKIQSVFQDALFSGSTSTAGMNLNSPLTIGNYNSSGAAVTPGNAQIGTNATGVTGTTPSGVTLTTSVGATLPAVTLPSALLTAQCPNGTSGTTQSSTNAWVVPNNTTYTFTGSGNYSCSYLQVGSNSILYINTSVALYLTATDPATGPSSVNGEDIRGGGSSTNLGYVKILSGGSLTIYAAGRVTLGTNTPDTLNTSSNVDFLNQDLYDSALTYPIWSAWSNATAYSVGTLVTYNAEAYQSILAGTNKTPSSNPTYWSPVTTYVTYNNQAWGSTNKTSYTSSSPSPSTSYWTLSTYSATTSYAQNAYVTYGSPANAWRSLVASNLGHTPPTPPATSSYWILSNNPIPANLAIYSQYVSPPVWSSLTAYAVNSVVTYAGGAWQSIKAGTNQPPATGSTYWSSIIWNTATTYSNGALVTYPGSSQIWQSVTSNNKGKEPDLNTSSWNAYAGVEIDNDSKHFYGVIYAPQSLVFVNQSETVSGSVVGNMVNVQPNSVINYDQSLATNTTLPEEFALTSWEECVSAGICN